MDQSRTQSCIPHVLSAYALWRFAPSAGWSKLWNNTLRPDEELDSPANEESVDDEIDSLLVHLDPITWFWLNGNACDNDSNPRSMKQDQVSGEQGRR